MSGLKIVIDSMIIGIGGVSRAGKTTLAFKIREWLGKTKVCILHQDKYIHPENAIPRIKDHIDWEHPGSLDFEKLISLTKQKSEEYPVVIVEGLMAFHSHELLKLMDKKIYIRISKDAFLNRKTLDNRWGDEPNWYIDHIWDSHFVYGLLPEKQNESLLVDGEECDIDETVQQFLDIPKIPDYDYKRNSD